MLPKFIAVGRAEKANGIDRNFGVVHCEGLDDADVDVEPHDRHVGVDQRVVQPRGEDLRRPLGADLAGQHALILVEGRARALAVVERGVAGPAVAVADDIALAVLPGARGLLLLGLDDGRALAIALAAGELHALFVDGRGVAERHVIGVEHVLDLELPVAVVDVAVHAGVERERPVGCAVDEVVDIALHRADVVFEVGPPAARVANTKPRYSPTPGACARPRMARSNPSPQPSGTGTFNSLPSVS